MYFIKRLSDDMWLMGYMRGGCNVPTCIWGQRKHDAMPFEDVRDANRLAKIIGGCKAVFMNVEVSRSCNTAKRNPTHEILR